MKKKKLRKVGTLILTAAMMAASITGCSTTKTSNSTPEEKQEGGTVSYWTELNANVAANYSSLADTTLGKKLQADTEITIDFQHPAVGQVSEQFNLLLSNKKLPDIIEYNWLTYPGGPQKAIEDGVALPLNDIIEQYCPNLKAYLKANPEIDKMVKTDDGTYYCFPFIRGGEKLLTSLGPIVRQDWLDELGMEVPTTIDEWHTMLLAFKEKKGAAAPFTYLYSMVFLTDNNPFALAYGAPRNFFIAGDGTIQYGAIQDGYKEYLKTMNQWMNEGLIDVDLATLTQDQVNAKMTNGSSGASFGYNGSSMGNWSNAGKATDPNFLLSPAPYIALKKGEKPEFGQKDNNYIGTGSAIITTSCQNVELAARLLDFAYSEKGHLLYNFGEEGTSYTLENGEPVYTDTVLKDPKLSVTHAMSGYIRANYNGPFVQDERYAEQYYMLDSQKKALEVWSDTNAVNHIMPPLTPNVDESKEQAQIMNEINTYRDEMTLKFILGNKSFDEWDSYVQTIKDMKLDRALEIQNAALERYNAR